MYIFFAHYKFDILLFNNSYSYFVKAGVVSITARNAATDKYKVSEATYELSIKKFKPTTKAALVAEIKRSVNAKENNVNLNYIDTSAITQNLDAWIINVAIRNNNWNKASGMFTNSSLANNLPSWCKSDATCTTKVLENF